ncbi:MAG: dihydropyrimidinase [Lachnospiraceae bacterium]|jgi:dihydropyrimidinase|nr:dihydropyrimidinase [Lachnospiraceae bacterium]
MNVDLLIKNGTVVNAEECFRGDVAVKDGKIVAVGHFDGGAGAGFARSVAGPGPSPVTGHADRPDGCPVGAGLGIHAAKVVDASGKYVLPGGIDAHTHMALPVGGTTSSDGYFTGTRAAACGGVTTIFDYPTQYRGRGIVESVRERRDMCAPEACVDYAFHCAVTDLGGGKTLDEFAAAVDYGVTSFKCYMVYKAAGLMVEDDALLRIMARAKEVGAITCVHAENAPLIDLNVERFKREGKTTPWYHYLSRDEDVEAEADKRAVHLAKTIGAPLYIVHMADEEGLLAARDAKLAGHDIFIETCPQYLAFTRDVYRREDGYLYVCSPPMKGEGSRRELWEAVRNGTIDTVATDHCPFMAHEKAWGKEDFTKSPNGCGGVENLYPYMLAAANAGEITFSRAVQLCASNPARIFGCTDKGSLRPGKDADIVIYDPGKAFTVSAGNTHSASDHTIWEGRTYKGYPVQTYVRGTLVYDDGEFVGEPGFGRYVRRAPHRWG